jgi:hypothetical protein
MSPTIALPLPWLRSLQESCLPDVADLLRYTETNTADGVEQGWATVASGIPCRVSTRGRSAVGERLLAGVGIQAQTEWTLWFPAGSDVDERDRVTVTGSDRPDGRTFEVSRVGERTYESVRELLCQLVE